jgi:hypothetical protein
MIESDGKRMTANLVAENLAANAWKLAYSSYGGELLTGQTSLQTLAVADELRPSKVFAVGTKYIYSLAESSNGAMVASGHIDGTV